MRVDARARELRRRQRREAIVQLKAARGGQATLQDKKQAIQKAFDVMKDHVFAGQK
jgi:hypothetical protein